jgi:hypothetical protein
MLEALDVSLGKQVTKQNWRLGIVFLSADPERRRQAIERLKVFAKGRTLDVPLNQLISEGRR